MEITLSPEYQTFAEQKVASGEYASLNELFSAALRPMVEQQEIDEETGLPVAELKRVIAESDARLERGEGVRVSREGMKDFLEDIIARGNQRLDAAAQK